MYIMHNEFLNVSWKNTLLLLFLILSDVVLAGNMDKTQKLNDQLNQNIVALHISEREQNDIENNKIKKNAITHESKNKRQKKQIFLLLLLTNLSIK